MKTRYRSLSDSDRKINRAVHCLKYHTRRELKGESLPLKLFDFQINVAKRKLRFTIVPGWEALLKTRGYERDPGLYLPSNCLYEH